MIGVLEDDSTTGSPRMLIDQPGPMNLVVVDWAAASRQGRQRLRNEDAWAQLGPIFVVADGMGGLDDGHDASVVAAQSTVHRWLAEDSPTAEEVVRGANADVRTMMAERGVHGGSTLSAVRIAHDQATVVHVGDSRVYRLRGGQAELLTRDHNLRTELLAAGIVPQSAQSLGPLRALTSYLGIDHADLQVDVRTVALRLGDRLVLCTDGVFNEVTHTEFEQRADQGDANAAADALVEVAARDDATAVVLDIADAGLSMRMH